MDGKCTVCSAIYVEIGSGQFQTTDCGHTFHVECLQWWFDKNYPRSCPKCRAPVTSPINRLDKVTTTKMITTTTTTQTRTNSSKVSMFKRRHVLSRLEEFGTLGACPICHRLFDLWSQDRRDIVSVTRCGHMGHQRCLLDWRDSDIVCPVFGCLGIINDTPVGKLNFDPRAVSANELGTKIESFRVQVRGEGKRIRHLKLIVKKLNARLKQRDAGHLEALEDRDDAYTVMQKSLREKIFSLEVAYRAAVKREWSTGQELTATTEAFAEFKQNYNTALCTKDAMLRDSQRMIQGLMEAVDAKSREVAEIEQKVANLSAALNETRDQLERETATKTHYHQKWLSGASSFEQHKMATDRREAEHQAALAEARAANDRLTEAMVAKDLSYRTLFRMNAHLKVALRSATAKLKTNGGVVPETTEELSRPHDVISSLPECQSPSPTSPPDPFNHLDVGEGSTESVPARSEPRELGATETEATEESSPVLPETACGLLDSAAGDKVKAASVNEEIAVLVETLKALKFEMEANGGCWNDDGIEELVETLMALQIDVEASRGSSHDEIADLVKILTALKIDLKTTSRVTSLAELFSRDSTGSERGGACSNVSLRYLAPMENRSELVVEPADGVDVPEVANGFPPADGAATNHGKRLAKSDLPQLVRPVSSSSPQRKRVDGENNYSESKRSRR